MNDPADSFLNGLRPTLKLVDEILESWNGEGCYKVPDLIGALSLKLNWDADQARRNDPVIRFFLKDHPMWYVTRGAHGGIMKRADWQKKQFAAAAKQKAKEEIKAALAAKEAQKASSVPSSLGQDNTNNIDAE